MSRFESPAQVVALFLVASLLSIGIIYFIKAEQQSRMRHSRGTDAEVIQQPLPPERRLPHHTFLYTIQKGLAKVINFFRNGTRHPSDDSGWPDATWPSPTHQVQASGEIQIRSSEPEGRERFRRSSDKYGGKHDFGREKPNIGAASSNFHRIRHALKKLDGGGLEGDVVYRMIFDSIPPQAPQPQRKKSPDVQKQDFEFPEENTRQTSTPTPFFQEIPMVEDVQIEESENFEEESVESLSVSLSPQFLGSTKNSTQTEKLGGVNQVSRAAVSVDICYGTDDVLVVIGITCSLNFAFVLLIWACVRWFSNTKEKDFQAMCMDGDEGRGGGSLEEEDDFWLSTSGNQALSRKITFNPNQTTSTSTSLYTIKREGPSEGLRNSFSMEDLRYLENS